MQRQAAYFEVGDIIFYGKYLNKRGKIVAFSKNEKGDPQVEIEPVPKGKKQNKVLKLFKIRRAPKTASLIAARYRIASRVSARYLEATLKE